MRIMKIFMFIVMSMLLSVTVSASDVGYNSDTEPNYVIYPVFAKLAEFAVIAADNDVPFTGTSIESLYILKPDKPRQSVNFIYTVLNPDKMAVMQNQNFDRVIMSYTF